MTVKYLLDRLPLRHKFLLLRLIALAMVAIPTVLYLGEINRTIGSARMEMAGLTPNTEVMDVIHLTQQHRGLTALALSGSASGEDKRRAKQEEAERAYAQVDAVVSALRDDALAAAWAKARADWDKLRGAVGAHALSTAASYDAHTALVAQLLTVSDLAADHFGLNRDPDRDLDHLLQAMFYQLPYLTEETGRLRAAGFALLSGSGGVEERARLALTASRIDDRLRQAGVAWRKATDGNPQLAPLEAKWSEVERSTVELAKTANDRIVGPGAAPLAPADYLAQATATIDAQFAANAAGVGLLQSMLAARVDRVTRTRAVMLAAVAAMLAVSWALGRWIALSVSQPLANAVQISRRIAKGDLTAHFDTAGRSETAQLMQALEAMNQGLTGIVASVRASANGIESASLDLREGNRDLSARTESQASSLQETAASMEEITVTVRKSADNARDAEALVATSARAAAHGGVIVEEVVRTMNDINDASRRVVDIIGVIESIAFQTNILALNAAIEAGRAGAQGRGFAVVAAEVRQLAQHSAAAANQIKEVITESVQKIENGNALALDAGKAMADVVASVHGVTAIMADIASAAREQSQGIEQVNEAVVQIDRMTQQNAALVEQSAAASEVLNHEADALARAVSLFVMASAVSRPGVSGNSPRQPVRPALARSGH